MCYTCISDISMGHSGIVFRVLCPKVSTGQEKLAPTGLHGLHVFATLQSRQIKMANLSATLYFGFAQLKTFFIIA